MTGNPRSAFRRTARLLAVAVVLATPTSCKSSFFQIHPEGNVMPVGKPKAEKPADRPAPAPADKPAAKPAERPAPKPAARAPQKATATPAPQPAQQAVQAPAIVLPRDPEPEARGSDSAGVARLARLAMVWHTVSLHHPAVASHGDDWDGLLVRSLPAIRAATDVNALAAAYTRLFAPLRDELTRVERVNEGASSPRAAHAPVRTITLPDGIVVLELPPGARRDASDSAAIAQAAAAVAAANANRAQSGRGSRIVIDLRGSAAAGGDIVARDDGVAREMNAFVSATRLVESLITTPLLLPSVRVRRTGASGDVSVSPVGSGPLIRATRSTSGWIEQDGSMLSPRSSHAPKVVVIANGASVIPQGIAAMIPSFRALLVVESRVTDASLAPSVRIDVAPGLAVRVRTGNVVGFDNPTGIAADVSVRRTSPADSVLAMQAAVGLLRMPVLTDTRGSMTGPLPRVRDPQFPPGSSALANDTVPYPYMGARVLAGYRLWSAMRARHAHRDGYDDNIDEVFERTIPRLEAARNRQEYADALLNLVVSFDDSQVALHGTSRDALGHVAPPFRARVIEGRAIVTSVPANAASPGMTVGAEIASIDGYPLPAWLLQHRRDVVASNEWTRSRDLMARMPASSGNAPFRVRDATGPERLVQLPRADAKQARDGARVPERTTPAVSRPAADIAYVDLDRLSEAEARSALAEAASARAVIVDLRGQAPSWPAVLGGLAVKQEFTVARVVRRGVTSPCTASSLRDAMRVCADDRSSVPAVVRLDKQGPYRGRVIALIDERTQGPAEQFALALEAGANATLIGSSSAGAAADTVGIALPGGLWFTFPPEEIRRADGGQLHRTGLTPVVEARQTVRGIRAGKDDVLDRAVAWVQGLDGARRR